MNSTNKMKLKYDLNGNEIRNVGRESTEQGGEGREGEDSQAVRQSESMHLACKALLLLVRHRGSHLKVR